jgi:hypothetical protein
MGVVVGVGMGVVVGVGIEVVGTTGVGASTFITLSEPTSASMVSVAPPRAVRRRRRVAGRASASISACVISTRTSLTLDILRIDWDIV